MKLAIEIEFLVSPQLTNPSQPDHGEWPPAPDRVFQALVATAAETGRNISVLQALEQAPSICASEARVPQAPTCYVPDNFKHGKENYHKGTPRYLPNVLPDKSVCTYIWNEVSLAQRNEISKIAQDITHIGRASSLVRAQVVSDKLPEPNLVPDVNGSKIFRVPSEGRLRDLQQAFDAGMRGPTAQTLSYRETNINYPIMRWFDLMILRPNRQLDGQNTVRWCESLRKAMMASIAEDIPPLISGHGSERRIAWTAIPDVGHKYAQAGILGLGCWLPTDISGNESALLWQHLNKIKNLNGTCLVHDLKGLKGLQFNTWANPSHIWGTVTPIALDRWPKRNYSAEQIIVESIERQGLPAPLSIECSSQSAFFGASPTFRYKTRNQNRLLTHAVIRWNKLVGGPLLLGAERFFGGGLCRPIFN